MTLNETVVARMPWGEFCASLNLPTDGFAVYRLYLRGDMPEPYYTVFREQFMVRHVLQAALVEMHLEQLAERAERIEAKLDLLLNQSR